MSVVEFLAAIDRWNSDQGGPDADGLTHDELSDLMARYPDTVRRDG